MTRELLVFPLADFDRPLAKRGRKAVKRMARWLKEQAVAPDRILCSPAKRAEQTALRLCRGVGLTESIVAWEDAIYDAELQTLLEVLARQAEQEDRVMIVGHNPGLEELVEYLAGERLDSSTGKPKFPTAALARLEMPGDWTRLERGCARLVSVTRPRELEG